MWWWISDSRDILKWQLIVMSAFVLAGVLVVALLLHRARWRERRPKEAKRAREGRGLAVPELARRLGMPERELRSFEPRYRRATIPKRSGGVRELLVPDDATKQLQRSLLHRLLRRLRAHPAAHGFERGRSIVTNALPHAGRAVVLRADIVDFFPSTSAERVDAYFRRVGWDAEAAALLTRLTTHEGGLPQGAPTSPRLSNLVNFHLDAVLAAFAARRRAAYTRYADDISISFAKDRPRRVRGALQKVRAVLKAKGYRMHGRKKLSIRRRHQRQVVTGLVVNDHVALPRRTRRLLRAMRHRLATTGSATLIEAQLQGWTALEGMVRRQSAQA